MQIVVNASDDAWVRNTTSRPWDPRLNLLKAMRTKLLGWQFLLKGVERDLLYRTLFPRGSWVSKLGEKFPFCSVLVRSCLQRKAGHGPGLAGSIGMSRIPELFLFATCYAPVHNWSRGMLTLRQGSCTASPSALLSEGEALCPLSPLYFMLINMRINNTTRK